MAVIKPAVNIKEVAHKAHVSPSTVSRVVNAPDKVRAATRDRVLEIIDQMNYIPKTAVPSNSDIIVYMSDFRMPFPTEVLRFFTTYAEEKGYHVLAFDISSSKKSESTMFEYFKKSGFAGIVLTGLTGLKSISADIPVVLLDTAFPLEGNVFSISSDNETTVRRLIDHLFRLNHKKIGFISGGDSPIGEERTQVFFSYMKQLGLTTDYIYHGDFSLQSGLAAFDYFYSLPEIPTAIIASNDQMAKGFIIRANNMGINVPQDISVCGIDALENDYFVPRITSIHQDAESMAKISLDYIINNKVKKFPPSKLLPVTFSPGNTCYKLQE